MTNLIAAKTSIMGISSNHSSPSRWIARLIAGIDAWHQRRRTQWELSRLDDRQLADIGVSRFELGQMSRGQFVATGTPAALAAIGAPTCAANRDTKQAA